MEIFSKRFPFVTKNILCNLDDQSLARSKEASKNFAKFLENERFYWIRIIKEFNGKFGNHKKSSNLDINKSPIEDLKQYGMAIQEFFTFYTLTKKVASVWTTEEKEIMELCEYIIKNAENGQLDLCKQIISKSNFIS